MSPARPHARRTARQGRGSQAPRGSAARRHAPRLLACLPARPPARPLARPEPLQPLRAAFLPSALWTSFAATGAELGKPAPAAGERRELKQETLSQGGKPGRRGDG